MKKNYLNKIRINPISKINSKLLFLLTLLMTTFYSNCQVITNNTAGANSYTIPAGVTSVNVQIWGSGGSGGGSSTNNNSGSGAGGGGYSTKTFAVTPGDVINYTIGAGATIGTAGSNGNDGATTTATHIPSSTTLTGNGGKKGNANSGTGGAGGTATGGTTNTSGSSGLGGGSGTGGNGGNGGNAPGTGGAGQANTDGSPGTIPGGGGGGGEKSGTNKTGGTGANGQIIITCGPAISNFTASSSICAGSTITITGTNLSNATSVTIGGLAVASITSNTATQIVAVVGTGNTGTINVTTIAGTAISTGIVTVNPLPANPGNPTSNSPQCNPPGVTLTRAATPPGTENYYWQTVSLGTSTANNASTYTATTSGTYYIRSQTIATGCWSNGQGSLAVVVTPNVTALATSPSPSDASTGICYSGIGPVTSVSWTAAAGATSYDVYFGAGSLPGSITSNVTTTSYNTGTLLASTTYYWKIVPKNGCGVTTGTPLTWTFTTTSASCFCTPTYTNGTSLGGDYISNVTLGTLNNSTGASVSPYYTFYNAVTIPTIYQNSTATISITFGSDSNQYAAVWIDFNQNGAFEASEGFISTVNAGSNGTTTINIIIPAGALLGNTRMRVRGGDDSALTTAQACGASNSSFGETEDYFVTIVTLPPCTTPTSQPSSLTLSTVTSTSISGSFTAASPSPSGYLIVRSTSATPPNLSASNGITYPVGSTLLGAGTVVIQGSSVTSNATTFSDTGLTSNTKYYYYVFSYNNLCNGAPYYLATSPLSNNTITCAATPGAVTNSLVTANSFTVTWVASAAGGSAGSINYTLEVYTDSGYTTPISGSPFSVGTGLTYNVTGLNGSTTYFYRVKANNGSCSSAYVNGSCTTILTNDNCSGALSLTVNPSANCGVSTSSTTVGATQSQVGCAGTADDDVWFSFVATGTKHTVTVNPGTLNNAVMELFYGNCAGLTSFGCINGTTGASNETAILTGLTSGVTYYIRVYSFGNAANAGTFNICITSPPTNDECAGAIPLTVSTACSSSIYSNFGATASTGMAAPGCANYLGGDVWFSAVVPATGELDVTLQAGVVTNSGMAFYSGTCGALTLLDCDDDTNGTMSYISMTGLTPGQTIYIRVWEKGNNNNGTFGICATTPSCPSPADLYANILSATSVTVYWANSTPAAANGYDYYINTTGTAPTAGTTPTGSTAAGVIGVTLTGLTSGLKYYFWVRSNCGGSDTSTWFGPTNYTPCAIGNGQGTTTLACIYPVAGAQGTGGVDPTISCSSSTCTDLEVTYSTLKQTTDYSAAEITYAPPYQFTCLQNPVSVNIDDRWSPIINLPFKFCFYGNSYDKCLMGSNGVITFNTSGTNYTPGGYSGWSFSNNLPSANLFLNSIFGVYHDIDPSKGGQVGWELITLNTGCRALVASWNEIPMYSIACNSSYYTGMIVLYENSNVIEVYVKEKNICSTWNDGNAIVGIQNANATLASFPTTLTSSINTNDVNSDWTAVNKAWRFTPNGPTITPTIQWYQGTVATGTPIPSGSGGTSSTINVCPTVTTTYTAEVTYPLCTGTLKVSDPAVITVTGNKIWNGSVNTDWNTSNNWTPSGVPTNANCVIIPQLSPGNTKYPIISAAPDGVGYNLAVYNNASLTINSSQNLTITDKVSVVAPNGAFTINNNANLVQINDAAINTGNIFYKRIAPNIKGSDYVYWTSPVSGQNMGTFYDSGTPGYKYQWNPILNNGNGASGNTSQGIWEAASGIMARARGYIIRGSTSFGMAATNIATTFNGTPFNGVIPYTIQRGSYTGAQYNGANGVPITNLNDNYNLLGNPYPSSINALKFLQTNTYNSSTNPTGQILGNIKLWTHGTDPLYGVTNPFYGSYQYNYDANDYLTLNYLGSTTPGVADIIKSGQAFFVQMIDGPTGSGIVNFNNSMRLDASNVPYNNGGFFRNNSTIENEITLERHRIWLDLVDSNSQSSRILLGYATDATNTYDNLFDAPTAIPAGMKLFSIIENNSDVYDIQGRSLPFDVNDEISIGIKTASQGNYTIAIAAVDGLFNSQNIYLKDTLLNITHDLKANPYHFSTTSGVVNDRFKIVYVNTTLGIPTQTINENSIKVITNTEVAVSSSNLTMESIVVFNVLGQKLNTYNNINSNYIILSGLHKNNTTLLLKIKLQTGETVTKKISY